MGKVIGNVWSTVKWKELDGLKFLVVRPYHLDEFNSKKNKTGEVCSDAVVAADILGAGIGEDVVVAYGHAARVGIEPELTPERKPSRPIDAAVVAIVDSFKVIFPKERNG